VSRSLTKPRFVRDLSAVVKKKKFGKEALSLRTSITKGGGGDPEG